MNKSFLVAILGVLVWLSGAAYAGTGMTDSDYVARMAHLHAGETPAATPAATASPAVPVTGRTVQYATVDGHAVSGYLARPAHASDPLPGIIVIHEWWGLNDNIRAMADRLAGEGYQALAVDLYGGHAATTADEAKALMRNALAHVPAVEANLRQAYAYLADIAQAPRIGVTGWCFGGGWSLQTALMFPHKIDAAVMYYGRPVNDRKVLATLDMPLLGLFGAEDDGITPAAVHRFEADLKAAGVDADIHIYPGAPHAFANPSGSAYRPEAAQDAWQRTIKFFAANLKHPDPESTGSPAG